MLSYHPRVKAAFVGGEVNGTYRCRICHGQGGRSYQVREMMFGTREAYDYFLCASCGCLQLVGFTPGEEQYPSRYYSYGSPSRATGVRALLRAWRNRLVFRGKLTGRVVNRLLPYAEGAERWISSVGAGFSTRILDVGCGAGHLVLDLVDAGFMQAQGIDPFIPDSVGTQLAGLVRKATLKEVSGEYDIVMFHHVLEHMVDPQAALMDAARLLRPGGVCLIRLPVIPNQAWNEYRENWVQLDAPRHIFIHSITSLTLLAERAGFNLDDVQYDSTELQFTGSELYSRGISLAGLPGAVSQREVRRYRRQARQLNRAKHGDQAAFYFRKILHERAG